MRRSATKKDELLLTAQYNHEMPPLLMWNQIELKLLLEDKCAKFGITGDMEIDEGNSFSYIISVQFVQLFMEQVVMSQFAPYDAMPHLLNPNEIGR